VIAELETVFDAELAALQADFDAHVRTIRICACNSDVVIATLENYAAAFELMARDTQAIYHRSAGLGAYWIEALYNTMSDYAAELFAVIHDTPAYQPLRRTLREADMDAVTLLQWAYNIEAFMDDVQVVVA
jgi:hypothetical protein